MVPTVRATQAIGRVQDCEVDHFVIISTHFSCHSPSVLPCPLGHPEPPCQFHIDSQTGVPGSGVFKLRDFPTQVETYITKV